MRRPATPPIGLRLASTAKAVSRAFDDALAAAGGSLPSWLVLISLKTQHLATQRALAAAVGIQDATLTHHLNAMEAEGLVTRRRDPTNRRVHLVELTEHGETAFHRMRTAAVTFDKRLRTGLRDDRLP
ncbi:MAG: MarR family winged helix-turn-helix transcriptional regulator [Actinomycetota bacterium]|nr:MarR family winged helix-turn-helix transcriptional regulator [Actinomycetota bacterium]